MQGSACVDGKKGRRRNAKEGTNKERLQWHIHNGRSDIDEPVGQKGSDAQKDYVVQQMITMLADLVRPLNHSCRPVLHDNSPTNEH